MYRSPPKFLCDSSAALARALDARVLMADYPGIYSTIKQTGTIKGSAKILNLRGA
jgi:hypothetical protein